MHRVQFCAITLPLLMDPAYQQVGPADPNLHSSLYTYGTSSSKTGIDSQAGHTKFRLSFLLHAATGGNGGTNQNTTDFYAFEMTNTTATLSFQVDAAPVINPNFKQLGL